MKKSGISVCVCMCVCVRSKGFKCGAGSHIVSPCLEQIRIRSISGRQKTRPSRVINWRSLEYPTTEAFGGGGGGRTFSSEDLMTCDVKSSNFNSFVLQNFVNVACVKGVSENFDDFLAY